MVRSLGSSVMLVALAAAAQAQPAAPAPTPAPASSGAGASAATLTPMERAQRDADKVFYWVKLHGNAPIKPAVPIKEGTASGSARPAHAAAVFAAPAPAPLPTAAVKRTVLELRTAAAPAPALAMPTTPAAPAPTTAPADRTAPEPADDKTAPATPAEPPSPAEPTSSAEPVAVAVPTAVRPEPTQPSPADGPTAVAKPAAENNSSDAQRDATATRAPESAPETSISPDTPAPAAPLQSERLRPIAQPAPEFPPSLVQSLRRGSVRVQFNVMPDGTVAALDVVGSSNPRLNPAALAAVAQWRFQPVTRAQLAQVDLAFSID
jgi:TonB family protein